ncbi:hypothetical protein UlMin_003575 [Ulmus minor]
MEVWSSAIRLRPTAKSSHFRSLLRRPFFHSRAPTMVETQAISKRPTCPTCSKPAWLCLCKRIKTPQLENPVSVTILQHSIETKHPLNSARIARLGLKNLTLATVSDVNFEARFDIRLLESKSEMGHIYCSNGMEFEGKRSDFDHCNGTSLEENVGGFAYEVFAKCPEEKSVNLIDSKGECSLGRGVSGFGNDRNRVKGLDFVGKSGLSMSGVSVSEVEDELAIEEGIDEKGASQSDGDGISARIKLDEASEFSSLDFDPIEEVQRGNGGPVITATIGKQGKITSISHIWMPKSHEEKASFDTISENSAARDALANGFIVQKLQKRKPQGCSGLEEFIEFDIEVPAGSLLLFPSEEAFSVTGLKAIDFEVKSLIVLDGTWAKARRIYAENPWLKLLPHLKLELDKESLYSEVRQQPKAGYLSTLESIIYTFKALGNSSKDLDDLLDVFESMVGDQRRCREERLGNAS